MNSTSATLRPVAVALALAAAVVAQAGRKAAHKELRAAVRALDVSAESGARAVAAVKCAGKRHGFSLLAGALRWPVSWKLGSMTLGPITKASSKL